MVSFLLADTVWYPIKFDTPLDAARGTFFWLTVALAIAAVVCLFAFRDEERRAIVKKVILFGGLLYACVVGVTLLCLSFAEDTIAPVLFYPLLALLVALAGSGLALAFHRDRATLLSVGIIVGAAAVAVLVCMGIHFANGGSLGLNGIDASSVSQLGLYLSAAGAIVVLFLLVFFIGRGEKVAFDGHAVAYAGVCVAASFALSYLRVLKMPQGGSITVGSLLPLMIYAYAFGVKKGTLAGLVYGVLQAFQDTYILHPAQFLLDYPLAFAYVGLAGSFAKIKALDNLPQIQIALGGIAAGAARFVMHFLAGMFAFGEWAPAGQPVWLYSLTYQAGYVLPDIAIAIVLGVLLFSSKQVVKQLKRYRPAETPEK